MKTQQVKVLKIHAADNVLVALTDLQKNEVILFEDKSYTVTEFIPAKHKFFIADLAKGDEIKMYGVTVGKIVLDKVVVGERMTTENTQHAAEPYMLRNTHYQWQPPDISKFV
ncbi:MAG: UxaA family hydrolase, partial [Chitinophagaceae bacterium]